MKMWRYRVIQLLKKAYREDVLVLLGQEPEPKTYNLKYAELMQKTFGINPKECILCHTEMELDYRKIGANSAFFYENHEKLAQRKRLVA